MHFDGKVSSTIDPYDHFNVKPLENEIEVVVGEPDMLNCLILVAIRIFRKF